MYSLLDKIFERRITPSESLANRLKKPVAQASSATSRARKMSPHAQLEVGKFQQRNFTRAEDVTPQSAAA
jgi:hypothetical protein